jgi:hypothetical protein
VFHLLLGLTGVCVVDISRMLVNGGSILKVVVKVLSAHIEAERPAHIHEKKFNERHGDDTPPTHDVPKVDWVNDSNENLEVTINTVDDEALVGTRAIATI